MRLETKRLILRPFEARDLPALTAILADEAANRFLPWFPVRSEAEARTFYESRWARPEGAALAVCLKADDVPVGYVTLGMEPPYDLGYGLREPFWHMGIVSEAAQARLEQARRDGIPYVTATHDAENPRSGAVMRRIGMRYAYSYREQWQPKDVPVIFRMYQINLDGAPRAPYAGYREEYESFVEAL